MTESTQSMGVIERSLAVRDGIIEARLSRINDIIHQMRELRRELRTLSSNHDLRSIMEPVTCLRCGYVWHPNNPIVRPKNCARCASTSWDKPPTANSRKPGDPEPKYWRGRRQSRKRAPRAILRVRGPEKSALEMAVSAAAPAFIPPPPETGLAPVTFAPPPDPVWNGSLSAHLREEPQPEVVTSHEAPPDFETKDYDETVIITAEDIAKAAEEIPVEVPPEQVGSPRTPAEAEELAKATEEAWPTTKPE